MHHCPHCQRSYQRKTFYDRHVAVCNMLCKSKKERVLDAEEQSDTPTVRDLYKVVMEMTLKYNTLEQKFKEMEKFVNAKKQKLDIVVWLNAKHLNTVDYSTWFNTITVKREHLEILFQTDYVNGVVKALLDALLREDDNVPVRAFSEKPNVFYIFQNKEKQWSIMDDECYLKLMYLLDKKFMVEFGKWTEENKDKLYLDDFKLIYAKNVRKIMATREHLYSRIKRELYKKLQEDYNA